MRSLDLNYSSRQRFNRSRLYSPDIVLVITKFPPCGHFSACALIFSPIILTCEILLLSFALLAVILQSSVVSQVKLLSGNADLPLLVLGAWALQDRVKSAWHWRRWVVQCLHLFLPSAACLIVSYLRLFLQPKLAEAGLAGSVVAMFSVTLLVLCSCICYLLLFSVLAPFWVV